MANEKKPHINKDIKDPLIAEFINIFSEDKIAGIGNANLLDSLQKFFIPLRQQPLANHALKFVELANQFMSQTDPDFKQLRDQNVDDNQIVQRFNQNASDMTAYLSHCRNAELSTEEKVMLDHVISLCVRCMRGRIEALKKLDSRIYSIYTTIPNQLRVFLDNNTPATHKL